MTSGAADPAPELTVIMPAFNAGHEIGRTLHVLDAVLATAGVRAEVIVVSDGSTDNTVGVAQEHPTHPAIVQYPVNLGKGHALKVGSMAASAPWVAWFDADLDLDPEALPRFLALGRSEGWDAVVGSKRHPESVVDYPWRRRFGSTAYQLLVRVLFKLRIRDTQVGLKLFRREVLEEVLPRVMVKRYAFDLEVLAVANHLGYRAIVEQPVRLSYQFSGTGMNWRAVGRALWDTGAVYYRMRVRRQYDR